jgi:glycerate-2-kinase
MNNMLLQLFTEALEARQPGRLVREIVHRDEIRANGFTFPLESDVPVYLIATGKASLEMGEAVCEQLGEKVVKGLTVTGLVDKQYSGNRVEYYRGSHPVPDEHSYGAGIALKEFVQDIPKGSLAIYCLSGGTSSLVCLPAGNISITELQKCYELLNNSGANIYEMNTVRKHLSQIKGGQLLRCFHPEVSLIDLIISDVPGDDPSVIGSGPTTPDASGFIDAQNVFMKYRLWEHLPASVQDHMARGMHGEVPETLKPGEDPLKTHHTFIIGSARKLAEKVQELASQRGWYTLLADEPYNRDVQEVADLIARKAIKVATGEASMRDPVAIICYGEATVNVTGDGKGGRNQELALWGALKIAGHDNITWLSAGTDGIDGPTDAAGAIVDGTTIPKARRAGLDPEDFLKRNDAYHFHEEMGTLLRTGPTGNNLMDLQIVLVE